MEKKNQILTEEEISKLKELQVNYQNLVNILGNLSMKEIEIGLQKEKVKQQLENLKNSEKTIAEELEAKYGVGNVSLDTGEFIPFEK